MRKSRRLFSVLLTICLTLSGCAASRPAANEEVASAVKPELPQKLGKGEDGVPELQVYDVEDDEIEEMDLEEYVEGVVAGEMKNDWPLEALKAQAILARTFVLKFCDTKQSRYEGADISTSVEEAQAYAPQNVNDRIEQAVEETRGIVMSSEGEYPYAWFFAHAGGTTELPSVALDYKNSDPEYLSVVESPDSPKAPDDVKRWTATFTLDQVKTACKTAGLKVDSVRSVEAGEKGESGRLKTLLVNGESVSAPSFRIAIGANVLKSTLIDDISVEDGKVTFTGSGFGHGVGMSQWGAYALAEEGRSAEEIVRHYFQGVDLVKMW